MEGKNTWRTAQKDGRESQAFDRQKPKLWLLEVSSFPRPLCGSFSLSALRITRVRYGWGRDNLIKPMPTSSNLCQVAVIGHSLGSVIMFDLMQKAPGSHLYLSYLAEMASNAVASRGWNDFHMACIALLRRCGWHILELVSRCCLSQQQSPRFFNETWSTWNVQDSSTSSPKKTMVSAPAKPVHVATPGSMDRKGIKILKDCGSAKLVCRIFEYTGYKTFYVSLTGLIPWSLVC